MYDKIHKKAYNLASNSCDPEFDDKKLDEAFDFDSDPLLEKEVDSAVDLEVESAKFEPTIEE